MSESKLERLYMLCDRIKAIRSMLRTENDLNHKSACSHFEQDLYSLSVSSLTDILVVCEQLLSDMHGPDVSISKSCQICNRCVNRGTPTNEHPCADCFYRSFVTKGDLFEMVRKP